jgi:predicted ribosome quality control (RQC) complex YloA/Tae2 family protein
MTADPTPKDRFTSLDTLAVARELRGLGRGRVDKAFDLPGGGWSLALRAPGEGRRELLLVPGRYAALLERGAEHPEELSNFAKELRRLLTGAALRGVGEPAGERYLEITLGRTDDPDPLVLALEMFGKGNLLVARGGTLAAVAEPRRWAQRQVRVGAPYSRPPTRLDPWAISRAELESELARSRTDLTSTLAARLSFGGPVAEELIARAGVDGTEPAPSRAPEVAARLWSAVAELLREVGEKPVGHVYARGGTLVDATPYPSRRWASVDGVEETARATFSEAAHEYFRTLIAVPPTPEEAEATRRSRELERLREQQSAAIAGLTESIQALRETAETILTHYPEVEAAIERRRTEGGEPDHVEVEVAGRSVPVSLERSPRESARELFEEVKRQQAKLAGARAALAETEARRSQPDRAGPRRARAATEEQRRHKPHWFERFRWFLSSEGAVVIAGRDAASNDLVVRRNLKDGDRYVHADLHGAASVIVKHPAPGAPELTEVTLREAGQWAVVFSKAWRAGLASASAFWVEPDQVSKAAASGEFVARGAWAIHGAKNVLRDLPLEIGIGTVDVDGDRLWTSAPPAALRARGALLATLVPGEERSRGADEAALAAELALPRARLQPLLPAGGIEVRRT